MYGTQKAGALTKKTPLKRGLVYKALDDLVALGLVTKEERDGSVARFRPEHPSALRRLAEQRKQQALDAQLAIDASLGALISEFNLASGKPGVEFFEGEDGVQKVLEETLHASTEILTLADLEAVNQYASDINRAYQRKRKKSTAQKKMLLLDSEDARKRKAMSIPHTQVRILKNRKNAIASVMHIYDNKVAFITFKNNILTTTLIHDEEIYNLQKSFFLHLWEKSF